MSFPVGTFVVYTRGQPHGEITKRHERAVIISEPFIDEPEEYQWVASWPNGIMAQPDVTPELPGDFIRDPRVYGEN